MYSSWSDVNISTQEPEDTPKFKHIVRDDIDISRRQMSNSRRRESMGSEVDTLFHRLRRLEEAQKLSISHLKGSVDKSKDNAKVHFSDKVAVNFYKQEDIRRSSFPDYAFFRNSLRRSSDLLTEYTLPMATSIFDSLGLSSHLDTVSDASSTVGTSSNISNHEQSNHKQDHLKSALKMHRPGSNFYELAYLRSFDTLYGKPCLAMESEVDVLSDSGDELPSFLPLHEHEPGRCHRSKIQNLRNFLCCRKKSTKHLPKLADKNNDVQGENVSKISESSSTSRGSKTGSISLKRSDLQKLKYFRDHRKVSTDTGNKFRKMVNFLKGK